MDEAFAYISATEQINVGGTGVDEYPVVHAFDISIPAVHVEGSTEQRPPWRVLAIAKAGDLRVVARGLAGAAATVRVFDAAGRLARAEGIGAGSNEVTVSGLVSGVYFVQLVAQEWTGTTKAVLIR